jgi:hypothetical protein
LYSSREVFPADTAFTVQYRLSCPTDAPPPAVIPGSSAGLPLLIRQSQCFGRDLSGGRETSLRSQDQERVILRCFSGFYRSFQTRSDRNDAYACGKGIRSIPRSLLLGSADPSLLSQYPQEAKILYLVASTPALYPQLTRLYFKMAKAGFYAELVGVQICP